MPKIHMPLLAVPHKAVPYKPYWVWQMEYRLDETSQPQIAHLSALLSRNKSSKLHRKMFFWDSNYRMLIKFELNSIIRFWWAKQEFGIYGWCQTSEKWLQNRPTAGTDWIQTSLTELRARRVGFKWKCCFVSKTLASEKRRRVRGCRCNRVFWPHCHKHHLGICKN